MGHRGPVFWSGLGNVALFLAVLILLSKLIAPRRQSGIDETAADAQFC